MTTRGADPPPTIVRLTASSTLDPAFNLPSETDGSVLNLDPPGSRCTTATATTATAEIDSEPTSGQSGFVIHLADLLTTRTRRLLTSLVQRPAPRLRSAAKGCGTAIARCAQSWLVSCLTLLVLAIPVCVSAEQFVLFDVEFTFTKNDADHSLPSQSHYYVKGDRLNPKRPRDWTAPIDYRNGTVHIRAEVIEKPPGGEPTTWTICYIPNRGQGGGYGCTGTELYREKGIYERDVSMKSFWQNDAIIWSEGIKQMDLVMKDGSGGSGHAHKRTDPEKFFPTRIRITVTQVSAGSNYDPNQAPPSALRLEPNPK